MQRNKNPSVIEKELTARIRGTWGGGLGKKVFAFSPKVSLRWDIVLLCFETAHAHCISLQQYLERTIPNNRVLNIRLKRFSVLHIHLEELHKISERNTRILQMYLETQKRGGQGGFELTSQWGWLIYFRHQCESKFQLYPLDQTQNTMIFILWPWQRAWVYLLWKAGKL